MDFSVALDMILIKEGEWGDRKPKRRQKIQEMMDEQEFRVVWRIFTQTRWHSTVRPESFADWTALLSQMISSAILGRENLFKIFFLAIFKYSSNWRHSSQMEVRGAGK